MNYYRVFVIIIIQDEMSDIFGHRDILDVLNNHLHIYLHPLFK